MQTIHYFLSNHEIAYMEYFKTYFGELVLHSKKNKNLFSRLTDKNDTHLAKYKNLFVWYNYAVRSFMLIINNYLPLTVLHDTYAARTHLRILPNFLKSIVYVSIMGDRNKNELSSWIEVKYSDSTHVCNITKI
ncbi:hypothetical protein QTP88_008648 [Uroleucon formosanum]